MSCYNSSGATGSEIPMRHTHTQGGSAASKSNDGYYGGVPTPFISPLHTPEFQSTRLSGPPMTYYSIKSQVPPRKKTDAFVANDPWRPHIRARCQKDAESFDDIPLPDESFHYNPPVQHISEAAPFHNYDPPLNFSQPVIPSQPPIASQSQPHPPEFNVATSDYANAQYPISLPRPTASPTSVSTGSPRPARPVQPFQPQIPISESPTASSLGSLVRPPHQIPSSAQKAKLFHRFTEFFRKKLSPNIQHTSEDEKAGLPNFATDSLSDSPSHSSMYTPPSYPHSPSYSFHQTFMHSEQAYLPQTQYYPHYEYAQPPHWFGPLSQAQSSSHTFIEVVFQFVFTTLPGQIYLNILLRLPSLYFSRVARIFEEADLTLSELKKMALETASYAKGPIDPQVFESNDAPQYERLKSTWESFIDSVMREWKTFNIISVLLLSAILTILQIESAADDPITRYSALFSMICALISLLFGCMYIIRFGTMRKTYKAAEWALEAKRTKTGMWWNVWVMLAMPAIWLTWSIVSYIACIMSFIWRTSPQDSGPPVVLSQMALLIVRIIISSTLGLGLVYGALILSTFRRYGGAMDRAWKQRIDGWIEEKLAGIYPTTAYPVFNPGPPYSPPPWPLRSPTFYSTYHSRDYAHVPQDNYQMDQRQQASQSQNDFVCHYPISDPAYYGPPNHASYPNLACHNSIGQFVPRKSSNETTWNVERQNHYEPSLHRNVTEANSSVFNYSQSMPMSGSHFSGQDPPLPSSAEGSSRRQGIRRTPLARPPAPYLPPIPGSPDSEQPSNFSRRSHEGTIVSSPTSSMETLSSLGLDIPNPSSTPNSLTQNSEIRTSSRSIVPCFASSEGPSE